jgi:hypothetical protein
VDLDEKDKHGVVVPLFEMLDLLSALEVLLDE